MPFAKHTLKAAIALSFALSSPSFAEKSENNLMEKITRIQEDIAVAKAKNELRKVIEESDTPANNWRNPGFPDDTLKKSVPLPKLRAVYGMGNHLSARIELANNSMVQASKGDALTDGWMIKKIYKNKVFLEKNTPEGKLSATLLLSGLSSGGSALNTPMLSGYGAAPSNSVEPVVTHVNVPTGVNVPAPPR